MLLLCNMYEAYGNVRKNIVYLCNRKYEIGRKVLYFNKEKAETGTSFKLPGTKN